MAIVKWGAPKIVSQTNTGGSDEGTVTALPNGGYVVVWNYVSGGTTVTSFQVYNGLGVAVGPIRNVASTVGAPRFAEVTALKDGSFVIAWSGAGTAIQAQKFSVTGVPDPAGPFTIAGAETAHNNDLPVVASSGASGWVTVWADDNVNTTGDHIWFKRENGEKISISSLANNGNAQSGVTRPDVTELANGSHLVTWEQSGDIKFAIVGANNSVTPVGTAFDVASQSAGYPSITALSGGGFLISWITYQGSERYISTKAYNAQGQELTNSPLTKAKVGVYVDYPHEIIGLTKGGFAGGYAIVWVDNTGGDNADIYMQLVRADGSVVGPTLINDGLLKNGSQRLTSVTELPDGRISVVWDNSSNNPSLIHNQIIDAREQRVTVEGIAGLDDIFVGTTSSDGKFSDNDTLIGHDGNDTLYGGGGQDFLFGENDNDTLYGEAGDDYLRGGWGADNLIGGEGGDWAVYSDANSAIIADLSTGKGKLGEAEGDTYNGIENLVGGDSGDTLIGDKNANWLVGEGGNDRLYGGAGADTMDGGNHDRTFDIVSYENAATFIVLDLSDTTGGSNRNDAFRDRFISIEGFAGSRFGDTMKGANGDEQFYGYDGNDLLQGGGGNDYLEGQNGNDTLEGGLGQDELVGDDGFDYASYANATTGVEASLDRNRGISGEAAGDTYKGIEGLIGSGGADTLWGSTSNDVLQGGAGNDQLIGMEGADLLMGGDQIDHLSGSEGSDTLEGGAGGDILDGGDDIDFASYANARTGVTADLNNSQKFAPGNIVAGTGDAAGDNYRSIEGLIGSAYADTLIGDGNANVLRGGGGNDTLTGGAGADTLEGGAGDDTYYVDGEDTILEAAGQGIDTVIVTSTYKLTPGASIENIVLAATATVNLTGNELDNVLTGNAGANTLEGQGGNDVLIGGAGADAMVGGTGNDTYYVDDAGDVVIEAAGQGYDTVYVNTGAYVLSAGAEVESLVAGVGALNLTGSDFANTITGNALSNSLWGQAGNDRIMAGAGNDKVYGGADNDQLWGEAGNDQLKGDAGHDRINGGLGNDRLWGGTGKDVFVFDTRLNKRTNVDKIYDFKSRDDSFHLDNAIFTKLGRAGSEARPKKFNSDMFVEGKRAQDREDRIVYDKKTGNLYYDQDGTGSKAQVKIATLTNKTKLYWHDFFVI